MASQNIPSDIVFEILTRTKSLTTLDTCKLVCKEWNQMIYESSFIQTYCKRTQNLFGFFTQDPHYYGYRSMFMSLDDDQSEEEGQNRKSDVCMADIIPHDVRILASCNQGILCCVRANRSGNSYQYYACKPATKQWQPLPNPKLPHSTESLSIIVLSSSPLRYKIVRLSMYQKTGLVRLMEKWHYNYECEIFDSKFWAWRKTQPLLLPYLKRISSSSLVVSRTNSIYWLTTDNVVQFDYVQECFNKIPLPKLVVKYRASYRDINLMDYQGRLGLTCLKEKSKIELWLIKNLEKGKWRKKTVVDIENLEKHVTYPTLVGFYNAEIAFLTTFLNEVVFYNFQDDSFSKVKLRNETDAREVFQFRSDLEPVELKGMESQSPGRKIEHLETKCPEKENPRMNFFTNNSSSRMNLLALALFLVVIGIVLAMQKLI